VRDLDGFRQFMAARYPDLVRTAYLLLGDWGLAEDLVQTALVKTHGAWSRLQDPANAEAYTRKVMARTAMRWSRRRRPGHGDRPLTSVWTGKSLLLWTVRDFPGTRFPHQEEQVSTRRLWVLDPAGNRWTDRLSGAVPRALANASAVWTGDRAIVWDGSVDSPVYRPPLDTPGAVYDPAADRWSTMAGSPVGGARLTAVWTGRSLLAVDITSGVGAWDPDDNRWTSLPSPSGSLDGGQSAVWTGRELLVWGGSPGTSCPTRLRPDSGSARRRDRGT